MPKPTPVPMCRKCGYSLEGLLDNPGQCPECRVDFDPKDPRSYYFRPPFLMWDFWAPALGLAVGLGLLSILIGVVALKSWGWSVWLGVPAMVGCTLAYRARVEKYLLIVLGVLAVVGLAVGLVAFGLAGIFCTIVVPAVLVLPLGLGCICGTVLRNSLKKSSKFSQRSYLPILLMFFGSLLWHVVEHVLANPNTDESVQTAIVISSDPDTCYKSLIFYEDVTHEPPFMVKVALPRPLRSSGSASKVGDRKTCIYTTGYLTKQITEAVPGKRLAFQVVEQKIKLEHDVQLQSGSFEFVAIDATHTRVTLTTNYHPLLSPRTAWGWAEHYALHTLHAYVLEGIRQRAEARELGLTGYDSPLVELHSH